MHKLFLLRSISVSKHIKATSIDIAYQAGVSQSTVSRALRDSPLVSEETKQKIRDIAKQLNYKIDKNARNLRTQSTKTLALVIFEDPGAHDHINPFFTAMISSIIRATAKRDYDLLVSFHQLHDDFQGDYEHSNRADGIIFLGYGDYLTHEKMTRELLEQGSHFLTWGPFVAGQPGITIGCNNLQGGILATDHLLDHDCKHIAYMGDISEHCPEFRERYRGYCRALSKRGMIVNPQLQIKISESTEELGYQTCKQLMRSGVKFDGLFAASDLLAIGAMRALREKGLSVPEDIKIIGFDDVQAGNYTTPRLTTVRQNTTLAGEIITETLIKLINQKDQDSEVQSQLIEPQLIIRESCGGRLSRASSDVG